MPFAIEDDEEDFEPLEDALDFDELLDEALEELLVVDALDDDLLVEELFEEAEALEIDELDDDAEVEELPCGPDVVHAHPNTSTHANANIARQRARGRFKSFSGTMSCSFQCDYSLLTERSRGAYRPVARLPSNRLRRILHASPLRRYRDAGKETLAHACI